MPMTALDTIATLRPDLAAVVIVAVTAMLLVSRTGRERRRRR